MAAKNKPRERGTLAPIHAVKSLVLRDVTPPTATAHAASRRRSVLTSTRPAGSRSARS